MPYITKDQVKAKRVALKAALPGYKLSVTHKRYSGIEVAIMAGPADFGTGHEQLNCNIDYRDARYNSQINPAIQDVIDVVMPILNEGKGQGFEDSDYGHVPDYYTWVTIGKWDKPYQCTK